MPMHIPQKNAEATIVSTLRAVVEREMDIIMRSTIDPTDVTFSSASFICWVSVRVMMSARVQSVARHTTQTQYTLLTKLYVSSMAFCASIFLVSSIFSRVNGDL